MEYHIRHVFRRGGKDVGHGKPGFRNNDLTLDLREEGSLNEPVSRNCPDRVIAGEYEASYTNVLGHNVGLDAAMNSTTVSDASEYIGFQIQPSRSTSVAHIIATIVPRGKCHLIAHPVCGAEQ